MVITFLVKLILSTTIIVGATAVIFEIAGVILDKEQLTDICNVLLKVGSILVVFLILVVLIV